MLSPLKDTPQDFFRRRKGILEPKKANERAALCDLSGIVSPLSVPSFSLKTPQDEWTYRHSGPGVPFN